MINAFKRWLAKLVYEGHTQTVDSIHNNKLQDAFSEGLPALVAFRIENGYVVRVKNPDFATVGGRTSGFVYCADHQAIADHIVTTFARERLGVQQDMFRDDRKRVNVTSKNSTAGLVGSHQAKSTF